MNQLKHRVQQDKLEYFLTYADNYAIGYFQKQGFTKTVAMPRERWVGYIKDYDGGTLMECYIHPGMDYLNVQGIVARQKQFIYDRLKERSLAGRVYPGLSLFQNGERLVSALDAPGVMDAGWGVQHVFKGATERDRSQAHSRLIAQLKGFLDKIKASPHSSPFLDPVSAEEVSSYMNIYVNTYKHISITCHTHTYVDT
jgi:histone acetyltransferase